MFCRAILVLLWRWSSHKPSRLYLGYATYQQVCTTTASTSTSSIGEILTAPHGGGGGGSDFLEPPCNKLKKLFDPTKGNIAPIIINNLRPNIAVNPSGEAGASLEMSSTGVPTSAILTPTSVNNIGIPTGSSYYSGIHTHPLDTSPMFSWSDVYLLNGMNNNSASYNQGMASLLLVCQDDNGVFQTYAIVFDPNSLNDTIDQFMDNPENIGCTADEIKGKMDAELKLEYDVEYNSTNPNYERVFLKKMFNSNVSLYKANSTLTNWSKLSISSNSATATVNSTNCN